MAVSLGGVDGLQGARRGGRALNRSRHRACADLLARHHPAEGGEHQRLARHLFQLPDLRPGGGVAVRGADQLADALAADAQKGRRSVLGADGVDQLAEVRFQEGEVEIGHCEVPGWGKVTARTPGHRFGEVRPLRAAALPEVQVGWRRRRPTMTAAGTGLDRIEVRRMADEHRETSALERA